MSECNWYALFCRFGIPKLKYWYFFFVCALLLKSWTLDLDAYRLRIKSLILNRYGTGPKIFDQALTSSFSATYFELFVWRCAFFSWLKLSELADKFYKSGITLDRKAMANFCLFDNYAFLNLLASINACLCRHSVWAFKCS